MEERLESLLGLSVSDAEEEAFLVFSQAIPSQALGMIDPKAASIEIHVARRDLTIQQSPGLLTSNREQGTTGAVVWNITPLFAEWLSSTNFLSRLGLLTPEATIVELGAGVSGIVASTLGPSVRQYIATDQQYVLKLLKQNIDENLPVTNSKPGQKKGTKRKGTHTTTSTTNSHIDTLELDWELDSLDSLSRHLASSDRPTSGVDLIVACDCIYNEALIEPFNDTCARICQLWLGPDTQPDHEEPGSTQQRPTICLVAQQLRSFDVFEPWLKSFDKLFKTWRIPDGLLTDALRENTGFVVYLGVLR